jgi:uncharacterized membrane protein YbhN (UPF0104 family)
MTMLKLIINIAGIIAAIMSGAFWVRAAYAKVEAKPPASEGVGFGGSPVNVKDHTGTVLDFLQTYRLQSKWNARAALTSAATATLAGIAFLLAAIP